jgi:hypothetical protein
MKEEQKKKAIKMRKSGMTYSEILKKVPVAKSTLSLWLRSVGLAKKEEQKITKKRIEASKRGGLRKREIRIEKTKKITEKAEKDISNLTKRDLWLMGTMLHWAEGSKEKEHSTSVGIDFGNSDYRMIQLYLKWLTDILEVPESDLGFSLYIHQNSKDKIDRVINFWSSKIGFHKKSIEYIYFKKHNPKTLRKNIGDKYFGTLRIRVKSSTDLNRKVAGWVSGVCKNYSGIV